MPTSKIIMPVEMVGLEKEFARIIKAQSGIAANAQSSARKMAETMSSLNKALEAGLAKQGVISGQFEVPVQIPRPGVKGRFKREIVKTPEGDVPTLFVQQRGAKGRFGPWREATPEEQVEIRVTANAERVFQEEVKRSKKTRKNQEDILKKRNKQQADAIKEQERITLEENRMREGLQRVEEKVVLDEQRSREKTFGRGRTIAKLGQDLRTYEGRKAALSQAVGYYRSIKASAAAGEVTEEFLNKAELDLMQVRARVRQKRQDQFEKENRMGIKYGRDQDRQMSHMTMGLASAGIGLFGQAGFPLLNIAFASMSGMQYAGIAAVATAAGELVRAFIRLQDEAESAAEKLKFIPKGTREEETKFTAITSIQGALAKAIEAESFTRRFESLKKAEAAMDEDTLFFKEARTGLGERFKLWLHPSRWGELLKPEGSIGQAILNAEKRHSGTYQGAQWRVNVLESAFARARKELLPEKPQWMGAEEVWKKVQAAAIAYPDEERRLALEALKVLREDIDVRKKAISIAEQQLNNPSSGGVRFGP